jgi:hypothetical protein
MDDGDLSTASTSSSVRPPFIEVAIAPDGAAVWRPMERSRSTMESIEFMDFFIGSMLGSTNW